MIGPIMAGLLIVAALAGHAHGVRLVRAPSYDDVTTEYRQQLINDKLMWRVEWDYFSDMSSLPVSRPAATATKATPGSMAMDCINSASVVPGQSTSWQSAMDSSLGSLQVVAGVWHKSAALVPLTVVTFGTVDRLSQLFAQCRHWQGPLSIVLYEPLLQEATLQSAGASDLSPTNKARLRHALMRVMRLTSELSAIPTACQLNLMLTYEIISEPTAMVLTPVNTLRNFARLQARTPLVAMLDADLLTSSSFFKRVTKTSSALIEQASKKVAWIIPAFDLQPKFQTIDWAQSFASLDSKAFLVTALSERIIVPFRLLEYSLGHKLTNFPRWTTAKGDYEVQYTLWCEPWLMGSRTGMPWHDERYRGYGGNKLQHTLAVNQTGHRLKVLHDAFVVHRPHRETLARAMYKSESKPKGTSTPLRAYIENLFFNQTAEAQAGLPYVPITSQPLTACLSQLPWWRDALKVQKRRIKLKNQL